MEARLSFRLPADDAGRLTRLAQAQRRSVGAEIRLAIIRHLERADRETAAARMSDDELDRALLGITDPKAGLRAV